MKRVVALGFFDGVHLGHGALLRRTVERAGELGAVAAACTFDAHPAALIAHTPVPLLTTPADRALLMRELYGVEEVVVAPFDQAMRTMAWDRFVTDYLAGGLNACHLVAGHDYRFGYQGAGTAERLQALCARLGLGCDIIPPVRVEGRIVSSTLIRDLVERGEVEAARRFLGHPYLIRGRVGHGRRLGSRLGFPTVNLPLPGGLLLPAFGVYAAQVRLESGAAYPAAANIGRRPTVEADGAVTAEAFLLDFDGDLYGREIRLELYRRLRPERRFDSLEALKAAVLENARQTRAYFAAEA